MTRSWLVSVAATVLVWVVPQAPAVAAVRNHEVASIEVRDGVLRYTAIRAARDTLYAARWPAAHMQVEVGQSVSVGSGCNLVRRLRSSHLLELRCFGVRSIVADVGRRGDFVNLSSTQVPVDVRLGPGVDVAEGSDVGARLIGGPGADWMYGGNGHDTLLGGGGVDTLSGRGESDLIEGNGGNDVLSEQRGAWGDDVMDGGPGNDGIYGGVGNDTLLGGTGNDELHGGINNDSFISEPGADVIDGSGGFSDTLDASKRLRPVAISDDGFSNDGVAGEQDNVEPGIEVVRTGPADDRISLDVHRARMFGGAGMTC